MDTQGSNKSKSKVMGGLILALTIIAILYVAFAHFNSPIKTRRQESPGKLIEKYAHDKTNIRSGRGSNYQIIGSIERGETIKVDSLRDGWLRVFGHGVKKGYVHVDSLEENPLPPFEIVSWNWYFDLSYGIDGSVIWDVKVRNNTGSYVEHLKIEFTTYDDSGKILTTDFTYVSDLSPGGTGSAKAFAPYFGREKRATIRIIA